MTDHVALAIARAMRESRKRRLRNAAREVLATWRWLRSKDGEGR